MIFFPPAFETRDTPWSVVITYSKSPSQTSFPQTDDAFTDRAIILTLFDGSGKRERWHGILLKYQFESEGRSELPAGTICLIPRGETTREGQGKSNCFAFVADEAVDMGLPQLS